MATPEVRHLLVLAADAASCALGVCKEPLAPGDPAIAAGTRDGRVVLYHPACFGDALALAYAVLSSGASPARAPTSDPLGHVGGPADPLGRLGPRRT